MAFAGKYELVKSEGHLEHLAAAGIPEEVVKRHANNATLEITLDGDKLGVKSGNGKFINYVLNQDLEEKTPDGRTLTTKPEINGNVLILPTKSDRGIWKKEMTLSGSELTLPEVDLSHYMEMLHGMIARQNKAQHAELAPELLYVVLKTSRDKFRSMSVLISQVSSHTKPGVPISTRIFKKL